MVLTLDIRYPVKKFNLNGVIREGRGNKFAANKNKADMQSDLYYLIRPQMTKKLIGVYEVHARWLLDGVQRDLDNLLLKSIFDCMQECGLLIEDNTNHIVKITHTFERVKSKDQGVVLTFTEVET